MAASQTYLELRPTSYYWRRRVPARDSNRFIPAFFCFSLQTHVIREAADLARRITAISNICFNAETDMPPEVMTQILIDYARLEIEAADQLRARTGRRTREAAESTLKLEAAARASLRDAIFLCDRRPALVPIRDTAARLGIALDEGEDDFSDLTGKMIRLMIELSDEKVRRAKGIFADTQPYLSAALQQPPLQQTTPTMQQPDAPAIDAHSEPVQTTEKISNAQENHPVEPTSTPETTVPGSVFHARDGLTVSVSHTHDEPAHTLNGSDPTILEIWDDWFDEMSRGVYRKGAYSFEDEGKAQRFLKESDTIRSTRKLIKDIIGDIKLSQADGQVWKMYNDSLRKLPSNHGKSSKLKDLSCLEFIEIEDKKERQKLAAAHKKIDRFRLAGDEKEKILHEAKTKRISPRTFQRHQKHLSGPLDHAVSLGKLSHNPFKPYVLDEVTLDDMRKSLPDTKRKLWSSSELAALLATKKWNCPKTQIDDAIYWAPLFAYLEGMRSEEILQLTPDNIRCDEGVHFIDIVRGTGQSVKSDNGRRMIPLHSQLIELGFLGFVEKQREAGKIRLFERVKRSKSKKKNFTATFTKNFTYYRKTRQVYDEHRDLHAMRTTFNTKLVADSTPDTARRYMMGHKNEDVGIINYLPEGFTLKTLQSHIEKRQIDLSVITTRFSSVKSRPSGPYLAAERGIALSEMKSA